MILYWIPHQYRLTLYKPLSSTRVAQNEVLTKSIPKRSELPLVPKREGGRVNDFNQDEKPFQDMLVVERRPLLAAIDERWDGKNC